MAAVASGLVALPMHAKCRQAGRVYRLGWLREGKQELPPSFWRAMRESGWTEGQNLAVEVRYASAVDQLPVLARELVQLQVDAILTDGTPATRAAKNSTAAIPIIFAIGSDPVERGFVASMAKPGANLTGFTFGAYHDKQLQILREVLPGVSRVAYPEREPAAGIVRAASILGIRIHAIPVNGPEELDRFFAAVRAAGVDAIVVTNIAWMGPHEERIAAGAIRNRVPTIGTWPSFARAGGLLSYGPMLGQHWPRLAAQVDKILKGMAAGDVPVEQPNRFQLVINMKTAKALGITIPLSQRQRADELIE